MMKTQSGNNRFFPAFSLNPDIHFETQHEGEKVILMLRAHPITQLPWIINSIIVFIVLLGFDLFFLSLLKTNQALILNIFMIVFILSYIWFNYLNWYFNVGIVTNERIIDVDFSHIIYKEMSISKLESVEDITTKSAGFFGSVFNYGDIFVQTAGTNVNIEFYHVPQPSEVVHIINKLLR